MVDLVIRNGRVVTPDGVILGGVAIGGGVITYVGSADGLPKARRSIDAGENYVLPGLIDPHVHLLGGRPGTTAEVLEQTFPEETRGAIYGGVTTAGVFVSPTPGRPLAEEVADYKRIGKKGSFIDYFLHGIITQPEHVEEIPILVQRHGVTSVKHYYNANKPRDPSEQPRHRGTESDLLFRSFEAIARMGPNTLAMVHCEDQDLIWVLEDRLKAQGRRDLAAWAEARPGWVEHLRMRMAYDIARAAGIPLYCVHIACAEGVELMAQARAARYPYWGETCPHYLSHTADMEEQIGSWGRVNTAIKWDRDRDRLWQGIRDGSITNVGTDHCAFTRAFKEGGNGQFSNIWGARSGLAGGMEHLLPVMMTLGVNGGRISIEDLVRVCCTNNACAFGFYPRKGVLMEGSDADVVIIDPNRAATIDENFYHCQGDWSIYYGWQVKGMARTTIVRGTVVMDNFEVIADPPLGAYLPR